MLTLSTAFAYTHVVQSYTEREEDVDSILKHVAINTCFQFQKQPVMQL